ncbi:MAG: tRNA lysidine(34) synthetase TilS, partial [Planctomycetaceae bacterium]
DSGPLLLALSGGGDSTALFRALVELLGPQRLRVAHLNHQLRGLESDADADFVAQLCARWHVPLVSASVPLPTLSGQAGVGLEAAARTVRYDFLKQAAVDLGCRCVATAHTADDQAETVLHRILRGTGLAGLAGIPPQRSLGEGVRLLRPLLQVSRRDLLDCLQLWQQPYCVDSSNT